MCTYKFVRIHHINSNQVESSLLFFLTQGVIGMTPLKTMLGIVLIVCLTIVIFTFINRGRLCELSIKSEHQEVAAKLACIAG
ncbi:Hok-gef cell toxic protein [Lelliottia jeotgali]|nr:Hok-gef cell toxic protein [Lelliottia jeotgali]